MNYTIFFEQDTLQNLLLKQKELEHDQQVIIISIKRKKIFSNNFNI